MKKHILYLCIGSAIVCPANAAEKEKHPSPPQAADTITMTPGAEAAAQASSADKPTKDAVQSGGQDTKNGTAFAKAAAMAGMAEVELGELAQSRAFSPAVKSFGKKMVEDHTMIGAQLRLIAAKEGIALPPMIDEKHQKAAEKLAALNAITFDKAYVEDMVKAHEKAVRLFNEASEECTNSDLRNFALATLPKLEGHLAEIKAIQKALPE